MTTTPISAVLDPVDDAETHSGIAGLADPEAGCVVVEIRPQVRRLQSIAEDLLLALGKDLTRSGADRNAQESWTQATAWIIGENTRRLIVTRCQIMPSSYLEAFMQLAAAARLELIFVFAAAGLRRGAREALQRFAVPVTAITDSRLRLKRRGRTRGDLPTRASANIAMEPELPDDDFPVFYSACASKLRGEHHRRFDSAYRAAVSQAAGLLGTASDREAVATIIRETVRQATTDRGLQISLRALQAAALLHGWLVSTPSTPSLEHLPRLSDPTAIATLRRYASTRHAAAGALVLLAPATPLPSLAAIRLTDVARDGSTVRIDQQTIDVPPVAAGILRSHRLRRLMGGARPTDGFLNVDIRAMASTPDGTIATPSAVLLLLRSVEAETGLPLAARWRRRQREDALTWARHRGYHIKRIPSDA